MTDHSALHKGPSPPGGAARRSATPRRRAQLALGFLWLVDAALQYQPYMFTRGFITGTVAPTAGGAPWIVAHPTLWSAHLLVHHIAVFNALFATLQLLIAACIYYRPTVRVGLAASAVWGVAVWWLAEGIGGIFNNASPLTGAPGAVILYVVVASLVWPNDQTPARGEGVSVAECGALGPVGAKLAWSVLWVGLALLALEQRNRSPSAIHDLITGSEAGQPSWIKALNGALAAPLAHHGTGASILLAALFVGVALGVHLRAATRPAVALAVALGTFIWLVENFGGIFTGQATDVNSGPILVLLAACFWPAGRRAPDPHQPVGVGPVAYGVDNDLALGKIVDTISHSKIWKDSAIFAVEDDSQNGVDHVDGTATRRW